MQRAVQRIRSLIGPFAEPVRRASRYDLVLAVIPAVFLVAAALGATMPVPTTNAAAAAAAVSGLVLVDALFLNPPRRPATGPPTR